MLFHGHTDTVVIRNPKSKADQTFFHRNSSKGGDVIDFIQENINGFSITGKDKWDTVRRVMAKFADEPIPDYGDGKYLVEAEAFAPYLNRVRDLNATKFTNFNLGFPYTLPETGEVAGYEIRGYNKFKSKAAGTNSTQGAWIVDMTESKNPLDVKNVYFAESGFDIMAFFQLNRLKLDTKSSVFVSLGGALSNQQITGIMRKYSEARAVDCFDNDIPGRIYGMRMAGLMQGVHLNIVNATDAIHVTVHGTEHLLKPETASMKDLASFMDLGSRVDMWKPAKAFKDWNDQVMNKPMEAMALPNKFQRNERLAEERAAGMKFNP